MTEIYIPEKKSTPYGLIFILCFVHLLLGLDINIVSVSLPSLAEHFNVNAGIVTRIVWIYFLILTCFLMGFGRLGDIKGFKKIYLTGISIFTISSFLCGLSFNFNALIGFRILQSVGGAILFALTPAIISANIPANIRGKVFGINYSFVALGGIIGRGLSGYLIGYFGWNSIFFINIPIGIIAFIMGIIYIPKTISIINNNKFDVTGSILIFIALLNLLFVINTGNDNGWLSLPIIVSSIISILFFILFYLKEKKLNKLNITNKQHAYPVPILNFRILRNRELSLPLITFMLIYIITNGMIYITPFFLMWIKNFPKEKTGLFMAIPSVLQMFSGYISGTLSDKRSIKVISMSGILLTILTYFFYLSLNQNTDVLIIIITLILYGIAIGLFIPANTNYIMSIAPLEEKGSISSFMTTVIRLGSAFGITFFAAIFSGIIPQKNPIQDGIPVDVLLTGFKYTFWFGIIISLITLFLTSLRKNKQ
jgi:DHA2 family metal-tetracycline-proton antiporter-like MFS transporter